jgi:hypothetical protein
MLSKGSSISMTRKTAAATESAHMSRARDRSCRSALYGTGVESFDQSLKPDDVVRVK